MKIVIYDTEFTTWEGAMQNNWGEDWQHREIVQIGAIIFDTKTMEELKFCDILVKPVKNPILSDYFMDLTGINQGVIDKQGVSFKSGYQEFKEFVDDLDIFSFGTDHKVLQENLDLNNINETCDGNDISDWFFKAGVNKGVNSGAIAKTLGVDNGIKEHNALDDVRSIALGFEELIKRGVENPFLQKDSDKMTRAKKLNSNIPKR